MIQLLCQRKRRRELSFSKPDILLVFKNHCSRFVFFLAYQAGEANDVEIDENLYSLLSHLQPAVKRA
jgi:hypothetical protein